MGYSITFCARDTEVAALPILIRRLPNILHTRQLRHQNVLIPARYFLI